MRATFERELLQQQEQLLAMGSVVAENLTKAVTVLLQANHAQARQLIQMDEWVNEQRINILMGCLAIIATQQPTGRDMRFLAAIMEIAGELERIHDYVKGIGRISLIVGTRRLPDFLTYILPQMAEKSADMLERTMDAFVRRDGALARTIPQEDDFVDDLFKQSHRDFATFIMADPEQIEWANYLQWATHNLERSADRVTNVCEWVVYLVTGEYKEMDAETSLEALPA
ncbi:MAG: phosphate signaling complex protein PhoU [Anaerolineae bacterium]|nr:phosphate signaling complex protein PhoU [Anaerolineae bacterium]